MKTNGFADTTDVLLVTNVLILVMCAQDVVQQGREEGQTRWRHRRRHGRIPGAGRQGDHVISHLRKEI